MLEGEGLIVPRRWIQIEEHLPACSGIRLSSSEEGQAKANCVSRAPIQIVGVQGAEGQT